MSEAEDELELNLSSMDSNLVFGFTLLKIEWNAILLEKLTDLVS